MKKIVLIAVVCCFIGNTAFSQAKPYYTQYILNNYILNPGITGIENYTDVKLSYRNQWAGINGDSVFAKFISVPMLLLSRYRANIPAGPRHGMNMQFLRLTMDWDCRW